MADDFSSLVAAGTTKANPLGAMAEGANQGVNWAQNQAKLDLAKQSHELDTQRLQQQKAEYTSKLGEQAYSDFNSWALMPEGSKLKKVKSEMWKNNYAVNSHVFTEDTADQMTAMTADPEIQKEIKKLQDALGTLGTDSPEAYKQITASMTFLDGMEKGISFFKDQNSHLLQVKAAMAMKEASLNMQKERLRSTQNIFGQKQYDKIANGADGNMGMATNLNLSAKLLDFIDVIKNPNAKKEDRINSTRQIRSILSNEEARLATGKSIYGEGTAANMQISSFAGSLKDLWAKIKDEPEDTISTANLSQVENIYKEMVKQTMGAHDRMVNTITPESIPPEERRVILGSAKRFQRQYGNKFEKYGGWQGEGIEGIQPPTAQKSTPKDDPAAVDLAQKYKSMLVEAKTPAGKAAILKSAQGALRGQSPQFFKKYGLE